MAGSDRIVVNGRFIGEDPTGVQRFAEHIVLALAQVRSDVRLVTPRGPVPETLAGVPLEQFGRRSGSAWEQLELPRYLASRGRPLLLNLANRAPILYRPKVLTLHDMMVQRGVGTFSRRFRATFRAATRIAIASGTPAVVTVSDFSKREIESYYRLPHDRTTVVPNAVDRFWSADGEEGGAPAAPYLLAFGRSGRNRNTGVIVDAAEALHRNGSGLTVKWVGAMDPTLTERLHTASASHEVMGRVSDLELRSLYRGAVAFVAPSRYEGFDLPPLEAQAAGTLVVASDIDVHREVLGRGAAYFRADDASALSTVLAGVPVDGIGRRELLTIARENADRYSWDRSAAALSRVLDTMLTGRAQQSERRSSRRR